MIDGFLRRDMLFGLAQVEELCKGILAREPNDIVRFRLLRDGLGYSPDHPEMRTLKLRLARHPWVQELAAGQHPDGSWGRFHSMDSRLKQRFATSEAAIRRALALGLDGQSPILARAVEYMQAVLQGRLAWSDRVERSEGWPICMEAITAGTLAEVDPAHPSIQKVGEYWASIAERALASGRYEPQAEWKAHKEARGSGCIYLRSRYVLTLLAAKSAGLPPTLDRRILDWIWNDPQGIGYLGADLQHPQPFHIFYWLESLEILSGFQSRDLPTKALDWLWSQRQADGLWDLGARVSKCLYFPLSDSWRKPGNRSMDHSVRVLALLRKYCDS